MRYQDWDVLLFPSGGEAHIPFKEFRTACYVETTPDSPAQIPLLSTFVPSLPHGAPFHVSVHSWVPTRPLMAALPNGARVDEVWEVKIVVDGKVVGVVHLPCQTAWPQIISSIDEQSLGHPGTQLHFPPFHQDIMLQAGWCAADHVGRIRVELGAGYYHPESGRFIKTFDVITFAFQHAPLNTLERCGVAWPNGHMLANPIMNPTFFANQFGPIDTSAATKRKSASTSNIPTSTAAAELVQPRLQSPRRGCANDTASNYDLNSRSTSAYSTVPETAGPLMATTLYHPTPTYPATGVAVTQEPLPVRLPSDQIQKIINALDKQPRVLHTGAPILSTTMPPPPVPQRALPSNASISQFFSTSPPIFPQTSPVLGSLTNRREESHFSDVSMHTTCTSFPVCTTEDRNGKLVHAAADVPASEVKGKKEGSAVPKPRDFFSTILDMPVAPPLSSTVAMDTLLASSSPADKLGKKRTRVALKALDLSDGSPGKRQATNPSRVPQLSTSSDNSNKENENHDEDMMLDA